MKPLSSGVRWLIASAAILVTVVLLTVWYQHRTVRIQVERALVNNLRAELEVLAPFIPADAEPRFPVSSDRRITLITSDGRVISDTVADPVRMENHADRPEVRLARRDGLGVDTRRSNSTGSDYVYVAKLLGDGRTLRVAAPLTIENSAIQAMSLPVILSTLVVVGGGGLALILYTWRSRVRVADLVEVSRAFAQGDLSRRAALIGNDAFARLGQELNQLGERLRESQERVAGQRQLLEAALGALAEGVACVDQLDQVVYANAAFRQFAAGGGAVVGEPFYRQLGAEAISAAITDLRQGKPVDQQAMTFEHRRRHLQAAIADGGAGITVIVLHDRTELVRAEAARRDFLSAVSHELKTPLTAIVGYTDTLLDGALDGSPADAKGFVQAIARHSERLIELIRDVLTLTRLEQGAWEVRPQAVDYGHLLRLVLEDHRQAAVLKPVALSYDGPDVLPGRSDPELVRQLIGNLVSNAIRYNRSDGSVVVTARQDQDSLDVVVRDTGIGIPSEHQERVFERFYRVDSHRSRSSGGTGLGLAIVKHLIGVLHGSVQLRSDSTGTTFSVRLPMTMPDQAGALRAKFLGKIPAEPVRTDSSR